MSNFKLELDKTISLLKKCSEQEISYTINLLLQGDNISERYDFLDEVLINLETEREKLTDIISVLDKFIGR